MSHTRSPSERDLPRALGFRDGLAVIVGSTIGAGIFRTPASIAAALPHPLTILALWAAFGAVALCGALCLAELASLMPRTGGLYVYLRAAYGDEAAFTVGWVYMLASVPAGIGALATVIGEIATGIGPLGISPRPIAMAVIVLLTAVNIVGVRAAATIQSLSTVVKVAALLALVACASGIAAHRPAGAVHWNAPFVPGVVDLAAAAGPVMFTYNGWAYVSMVAGELRAPERVLRPVVMAGMSIVVIIYLATNAACLAALPLNAMASTPVVATAIVGRLLGPPGATLVALCVLVSALGSLNGLIMTKSRVAYSLARDGLGFRALGLCHPRWSTPFVSLLVQGGIAIVLATWLRTFERLAVCVVVVESSVLILAIAAVMVLRTRMPGAVRPYRAWGYPVTPIVFVLGTTLALVAVIGRSLAAGDLAPAAALAVGLAGVPIYRLLRHARTRMTPHALPDA